MSYITLHELNILLSYSKPLNKGPHASYQKSTVEITRCSWEHTGYVYECIHSRSFPSCSSNKIKINKRKIVCTFCKHSFISSLSATVSSHWRRRRFRCTLARFVVCTAEAWERGASFIIGVLFEHVGKSVKSSALDRSLKFPDSEVFLTYFLREKRCWIFEVVSCFYKCSIGACFELKFDFIFYFWKKNCFWK